MTTNQHIYDRDYTDQLPDGDLDRKLKIAAALLNANDDESYSNGEVTVAEAVAAADINHLQADNDPDLVLANPVDRTTPVADKPYPTDPDAWVGINDLMAMTGWSRPTVTKLLTQHYQGIYVKTRNSYRIKLRDFEATGKAKGVLPIDWSA